MTGDPGGTPRRQRLARASAARARRNSRLGVLLVWLGCAVVAGPVAVAVGRWAAAGGRPGPWFSGSWFSGSWFSGAAYWSVPAGVFLIGIGRRIRVTGANEVLAEDTRAPVLYLRPFGADRARIAVRWRSHLRPLPESIGRHQFLFFDAAWTPHLLGRGSVPPPAGDGVGARALRRLDREFRITLLPLWARFLLYTSVGLALLVVGTSVT